MGIRWTQPSSPAVGVLRLVLFSAYAITLLTLNVMHFEREATLAVDALAITLWIALALDYALLWRAAQSRRTFLRVSIAYPIYLVTIVFITAHSPWLLAIPLIVGFVLQLRQVAAGRALTFALVLFLFIGVLATAGVVYAEQSEPESTLRDWPTAASWAIAHLIHLRGYSPGNPLSEDGIALSFVLAICGLIVAALLTAQIVSWVVGSQRAGDPGVARPSKDSTSHRAGT